MKNNNNSMFTTMYEYGSRGGSTLSGDKEYVFACKGRPFAALVSDHIATPSSTLLDYDLIKKHPSLFALHSTHVLLVLRKVNLLCFGNRTGE